MQHSAHSRAALRTFLKFRTCAEGWLAHEWTCWKPPCKAQDRIVARPLKKGGTHTRSREGCVVGVRLLSAIDLDQEGRGSRRSRKRCQGMGSDVRGSR